MRHVTTWMTCFITCDRPLSNGCTSVAGFLTSPKVEPNSFKKDFEQGKHLMALGACQSWLQNHGFHGCGGWGQNSKQQFGNYMKPSKKKGCLDDDLFHWR